MVTAATARRHAAHKAKLTALGIEQIEKPIKGRNKFHAVKCVYNGQTYDSAGEAEYARELDLKLAAGQIDEWERPRKMPLMDCVVCRVRGWRPCVDKKGRPIQSIHSARVTYEADFWIVPKDELSYYVDFKGSEITETTAWRNKIKQWRALVPFELRVHYADGTEKVVATGTEAFSYLGEYIDEPTA